MTPNELKWLQTQIPAAKWERLNERRKKLGLKWNELLLPATLEYLDKLEASRAVEQPEAETKAKARTTKQKEVNK